MKDRFRRILFQPESPAGRPATRGGYPQKNPDSPAAGDDGTVSGRSVGTAAASSANVVSPVSLERPRAGGMQMPTGRFYTAKIEHLTSVRARA